MPISPKSLPTSSGATSATWAAPTRRFRPAADAHLLDTSRNVYRGRVPGGEGDHRRRPCQAERSLSRVSGFRLPEADRIPISGPRNTKPPACQHSLAPVPPPKAATGLSSPERRQANATLTHGARPAQCRGSPGETYVCSKSHPRRFFARFSKSPFRTAIRVKARSSRASSRPSKKTWPSSTSA